MNQETDDLARHDVTTVAPQLRWPSLALRILSIGLATLIYPFVLWGAIQAWERGHTRVQDWLPAGFDETKELVRFIDRFGSDELLMIGWEGAELGDPGLQQLQEQLTSPDPNDPLRRTFFSLVWTGDTIEQAMREPPLELTSGQARSRMRGWILGDQDATAAIALISPAGLEDRHAAIGFARQVAQQAAQLPLDSIHLAGPTIESVFIDETSQSALLKLNGYSFLVCVIVLIVCLRKVIYAIVIFGIAVYCQQAAMALIHYSGGVMDSVLLLTANLTCLLSMSAAIHMFGYYREAQRHGGTESLAWQAFRTALVPTSLAAFTTAVGFGSLAISQIVPVFNFGLYSAIAAPIGALLTLWYLAMYLPSGRTTRQPAERHTQPPRPRLCRGEGRGEGVSGAALTFRRILACWPAIFAVVAVLMGFGIAGTRQLKTTAGLHDLFFADSKLLDDYAWLEARIGPLVPIETVLELPADPARELLTELRWVAAWQSQLRQCEAVGSTISALNFSPPIPRERERLSTGEIVARRGLETRLQNSLSDFEQLRLYHAAADAADWRVTGRVAGATRQDYAEILQSVHRAADDCLAKIDQPGVKITISGGVPLAARTQQRLLSDLLASFFTALVLIGITTSLVLRSLPAGLLALVPNVLPAVTVFGLMGWLGWQAEIGSVMTASAVLGIAIDDSLHLIVAFRQHARSGLSRQDAALAAVKQCRAAMIQTTLVCGLGMLVFAWSPFVPIARFAWLLFTLLMIALLADLLLLPAMLFSPLGEFFRPRNASHENVTNA